MMSRDIFNVMHTQALSTEYMEDFAELAGIEMVVIDEDTTSRDFKNSLNTNEVYYHIFK